MYFNRLHRGRRNLLLRKSKVTNPLWRPRGIWEDNIKANHKEVECGYVDMIDLFIV